MGTRPAFDDLLRREQEVDRATQQSTPRYQVQLEKTIIIATRAIIEALYRARY